MTDVSDKASIDEGDQILCKLAVKHRFISEEQVRGLLSFHQQELAQGHNLSIADLMLERDMVSPKQLEFLQTTKRFLILRQPDCAFARIAVKNRLITQDQIDKTLQLQTKIFKETKEFKPILDLLVEAGLLTPQKRDAIQAMMQRIKQAKPGACESGKKEPEKLQGEPASQTARPSAPKTVAEPPTNGTVSREVAEEDAELTRILATGYVVADETFYELVVSADGIHAFLRIKGDLAEDVTSETIKSLMASKKISNGLVDDTLLDGYLRLKSTQYKPLKIAEGQPSKPGKNAEIRYLFNTTPVLWDSIDEDKTIDLKNRGAVPQVKQGDLLAEKLPRIAEVHGIDVYGKKLGVSQTKDIRLMLGTGVELSQDGLKVFAKLDGRPELSAFGKLSVLPELHIDGDVSFETGNIAFEGSIIVSGVVQDGFRVKGRSLTAKEISKAELDISGDIIAHGGILGATIRCQGNVRAVHIHTAKIEAQGNVIVEKGIFDSKISTSGKCVAERGKIVSSKITAKQGVEASFIGSEISQPSTLFVGIDPVTEKQVEGLKASILIKQKEQLKHRELIKKQEEQSLQFEKRIGELAQLPDRGVLKKKALQVKLEALQKLNDAEKIAQVESMQQELDAKIKSAEMELDKLFDQQDQIRTKISEHQEKIKEIDGEIKTIRDELDMVAEWVREHPGHAAVKIINTAYAGTILRGPFSSLILASNTKSALIRESQDTDANEGGTPGRWRFSIQSLF